MVNSYQFYTVCLFVSIYFTLSHSLIYSFTQSLPPPRPCPLLIPLNCLPFRTSFQSLYFRSKWIQWLINKSDHNVMYFTSLIHHSWRPPAERSGNLSLSHVIMKYMAPPRVKILNQKHNFRAICVGKWSIIQLITATLYCLNQPAYIYISFNCWLIVYY